MSRARCEWCGGIGCTDECRHESTDEGVCCPTHAPHSKAWTWQEAEALLAKGTWKKLFDFRPPEVPAELADDGISVWMSRANGAIIWLQRFTQRGEFNVLVVREHGGEDLQAPMRASEFHLFASELDSADYEGFRT